MSRIVQRPSPNWNARPADAPISAIVLHTTASRSTAQDLAWLTSPASKVSYHELYDRDGTIYELVDVARRAWHAGASAFRGVPDVNDYAIGVCFANANRGESYAEGQLAVGAARVTAHCRRFAIPLDRIARHSDVALPTGRKPDPAPPWFDLAAFLARVERALRQP